MDRNYRSVFTFSNPVRLWSDLHLESVRVGYFQGGISGPINCGATNEHQDKPDRFYWYVKNNGSNARARGVVTQGSTVLVQSDWHTIDNDGNQFQIAVDTGWWPKDNWVVAYVETDSGTQTNSCGFQATGGASPDSGGSNNPPPSSDSTLELGKVYTKQPELEWETCGSDTGINVPITVGVQLTNNTSAVQGARAVAQVGGKIVGTSGGLRLQPNSGAYFEVVVHDWWPTDGSVIVYGEKLDSSGGPIGIYTNSCKLHALIPNAPPPGKSNCSSDGQKSTQDMPCCAGLYSCNGVCSSSSCPCVKSGGPVSGDSKCCGRLIACNGVCKGRCCAPEHDSPITGEQCCDQLVLCDGQCEQKCASPPVTVIPPPSGTHPKPEQPPEKVVPCSSNADCSWDHYCTYSGCAKLDCNTDKPTESGMLTFCQGGYWADLGRHNIAGFPTVYVVGGLFALMFLVKMLRKRSPNP